MNRLVTAVVAVLMTVTAGLARAENTPVVVELFTSQGCSSCPPADALLARLGDYDEVIPLALHVDYWDYIGWKDKFAHPAFTQRQKAYARNLGTNVIYTPQMVINGSDEVAGTRAMDVSDLVQAHKAKGLPLRLEISRSGNALTIRGKASGTARNADLILVRYLPSASVEIARGENAGKTLSHSFIVTDWIDIGDWDGTTPLSATVQVSGQNPIVVLVQSKGQGPILAAARLR